MASGNITAAASYRIRRLIAEQDLRPGDRLPSERELAERLEVSRTSVRAALAELRAIGLLDVRSKSGVYVAADGNGAILTSMRAWFEDNQFHVSQLVEFREAIEPAAARAAARRRTPEDLHAMQTQLDMMGGAVRENDHLRFAEGDAEFHGLIASASKNPLFVVMTESLSAALRVYRGAAARLGVEMLRRSLADHKAVYDAIDTGEPDAAADAMVRHIVETAVDFRLLSRQELLR